MQSDMFKLFNGIHLVEAYHEWKKQKRDEKIVSRMIKLAIAISVLILLWCLPSSVFGIEGLGEIQQRVIAIFGFAILMWIFEAIPAWTTSMAIVGLLLFATSDSSFCWVGRVRTKSYHGSSSRDLACIRPWRMAR